MEREPHGVQAYVATFFTSVLKIDRFRWKQKMRLRTFDGGGNTCFGSALPPISKTYCPARGAMRQQSGGVMITEKGNPG